METNPTRVAALGRSHSTPGLVESSGRVPLERMELATTLPLQMPSNPESSTILRSVDSTSFITNLFLYLISFGTFRTSDGSSSSSGTGGESRSSFRTSRRSSGMPQLPIAAPQLFGDSSSSSSVLTPSLVLTSGKWMIPFFSSSLYLSFPLNFTLVWVK